MIRQRVVDAVLASVAAAWILASLTGCAGVLYAAQVSSAEAKLEQAKELRADVHAPYEYYFAREHLNKAKTEAAAADYGDALDLAEIAERAANKAIDLSRDAHRRAGR